MRITKPALIVVCILLLTSCAQIEGALFGTKVMDMEKTGVDPAHFSFEMQEDQTEHSLVAKLTYSNRNVRSPRFDVTVTDPTGEITTKTLYNRPTGSTRKNQRRTSSSMKSIIQKKVMSFFPQNGTYQVRIEAKDQGVEMQNSVLQVFVR